MGGDAGLAAVSGMRRRRVPRQGIANCFGVQASCCNGAARPWAAAISYQEPLLASLRALPYLTQFNIRYTPGIQLSGSAEPSAGSGPRLLDPNSFAIAGALSAGGAQAVVQPSCTFARWPLPFLEARVFSPLDFKLYPTSCTLPAAFSSLLDFILVAQ